jgi:hypothetical protein
MLKSWQMFLFHIELLLFEIVFLIYDYSHSENVDDLHIWTREKKTTEKMRQLQNDHKAWTRADYRSMLGDRGRS